MLTKVLYTQQRNSNQIEDLIKGQANLDMKIDAQHNKLDTIIQMLDSAEQISNPVPVKGKKQRKKTEEFYQVCMPFIYAQCCMKYSY